MTACRCWDHPRSRGVYHYDGGVYPGTRGSSPLARGLLQGGLLRGSRVRIIPARAGFTSVSTIRTTRERDHPRSRGVYGAAPLEDSSACGSSPLARGLRRRTLRRLVRLRIIPARAGFTLRSWTRPARPPDHPRSRGVYPTSTTRSSPKGGSSPLARGLLSSASGRVRQMGSSPLARGLLSSASGRVRQMGSSPLARGLQHPRPLGRVQHGIIPARAGFTIGAPSVVVVCPDHPRSRGVYSSDRDDQGSARGSSPLARGLRRV